MDQATYERGLAIRKRVLGEAHVERSLNDATPFTRDFQHFATEYCWGAGWGRDGLNAATRSMLNIAILTAIGKMGELKLHIGGALRNGVNEDEIKEILLHTAIYCGIPAANDAFRAASAAIEEFKAPE